MKTKENYRSVSDSLASSDQNVKGKRSTPNKKEKNIKRALYQEIEEDEEIDYLSFKRKSESIEDYYDDDEEYLDDDFDDDDFDDDDEE